MTTLGDMKKRLQGSLALTTTLTDPLTRKAAIEQLFEIQVPYAKASDDSMAADATANTKVWTNPYEYDVYVKSGTYNANGTITAHDTNNAVITFKTDDGAAGTPAAALTWTTSTTGTGNVAAGVAEAASLTAASARVVPGGNLWFNIAKGGSGVVVRAGVFGVVLTRGE